MDIYVLIENTKPAGSAYISEHGLCLYFEHEGKRILFDTGASDKFIYNATLLGIDLSKVDICVISHGHYDHTGGLPYFLEINKKAKVYMKRSATGRLYSKKLCKYLYTGMQQDLFQKYSGRITFVDEDVEIAKGVTLSNVNKFRRYPSYTSVMYVSSCEEKPSDRGRNNKNSGMTADDLSHELFINVETFNGNTVISGCSHHGIINILSTAEEKFGKIYAVVGGFHLSGTKVLGIRFRKETNSEIRAIARFFEKKDIRKIYTGHCTGEKPFEKLSLKSRTKKMQTGDVLKI